MLCYAEYVERKIATFFSDVIAISPISLFTFVRVALVHARNGENMLRKEGVRSKIGKGKTKRNRQLDHTTTHCVSEEEKKISAQLITA